MILIIAILLWHVVSLAIYLVGVVMAKGFCDDWVEAEDIFMYKFLGEDFHQ